MCIEKKKIPCISVGIKKQLFSTTREKSDKRIKTKGLLGLTDLLEEEDYYAKI